MNDYLLVFIALLGAHAFLDFAGQGDFMSKAKDPNNAIPGVPWDTVLLMHAFIHGAAVALITQMPVLFFAEVAAHFVIDLAKCNKRISFNVDQTLHVFCKVVWFAVFVAFS